jgi:HD-GYP domain-containing protein (c-di-GMP phosphodiesterase class II)
MEALNNHRLSNLLEDIGEAFNHIEELHHPPTVPHEHAVGKYMYSFAKHLNMDEEKARNLGFAGKLHDIGKIKIAPSILDKAGPLDSPQRKKIEEHSEGGYHILNIIDHPLLQLSATLALYHHENFDGSGYPEGLKGDMIPFEGRICSICDVYDVLRRRRSYKESLSHQETVDLMVSKAKRGMAHKFDPGLLEEFEKSHHLFEKIALEIVQT